MRNVILAAAALSLSGCATVDHIIGRPVLTDCGVAQALFRDAATAEMLAVLSGKFVQEAQIARAAAAANVLANCPSNPPEPVIDSEPEPTEAPVGI